MDLMAMIQRLTNKWPLLAVALVLPVVARAVDVQIAGELGVGASDNIQRSVTAKQSEAMGTAGVQFSVLEESAKLSADVAGDLAYMNYARNTDDNEVIGNLRASTVLHINQDRFDWVIDDSFGQTQRDLFTVLTPSNREYINYLSTGPNFALNLLSAATRLRLTARYSRVDYETSPLSSVRYGGSLAVERELSSASTASINIDDERVEPEELSGVAAYNRQEAYGRYDLQGNRTSMSLDAGVSGIDQQSGSTETVPLLRFRLSRKVGAFSTLKLEAGREFTDAGSFFGSGGGISTVSGLNTSALSQTANPFVDEYARVGWDATGRRTTLRLTAGWADDTYSMQPTQNRKQVAATAEVSRQLGAQFSARLGYIFARNDFDNVVNDYRESTGTIGLTWRPGRRLSVDLAGEAYHYSSQNLPGNVNEMRVWLRLRYGDAVTRRFAERPAVK
jgi:hypothetical protein